MSINWAQLNERKQPIPINDEVIVKSEPNADLVLSFNPPDTNQAPSAKGKAKVNALKATGTVYMTDQRVSWFASWLSYHSSTFSFLDSAGLCLLGLRPTRFLRYVLRAAFIRPVHTVSAAVFWVQLHRPRHQACPWRRLDRRNNGRTAVERQGTLRTLRCTGEEQGKGGLQEAR